MCGGMAFADSSDSRLGVDSWRCDSWQVWGDEGGEGGEVEIRAIAHPPKKSLNLGAKKGGGE